MSTYTTCSCPGGTIYHAGVCESDEARPFSPDIDIEPVPLCDVCLFGCIAELADSQTGGGE